MNSKLFISTKKAQIRKKQDDLLGENKHGVTTKQCFVEIHAPDVVNLTVIDLPGLGKGLNDIRLLV